MSADVEDAYIAKLEPWERFVMLQRALEDVPVEDRGPLLENAMHACYAVVRNLRGRCTTVEAVYAIIRSRDEIRAAANAARLRRSA